MMTGKRTSLKRVLEKVYRDFHFNTEIAWGDVIEWSSEAINILGVGVGFEDKISKEIELTNGRGKLPCDLMYIKMVRQFDTHRTLVRSSDQFHLSNWYRCEDEQVSTCDDYCSPLDTYTTEGDYIFTNLDDESLEIAYKAIPTDSDGLPMIPDDDKYIRYVAHYIAEKLAFKLAMQNKLPAGMLEKIEQKLAFSTGSAKMKAVIPDTDGMEAWKNSFLRLVPTLNSHSNGFKYDAQPQQQRNHNSY